MVGGADSVHANAGGGSRFIGASPVDPDAEAAAEAMRWAEQ